MIRSADVTDGLEAIRHACRLGGVSAPPGRRPMNGDALAGPVKEHFRHALADAQAGLAADIALGHRVVIALMET